MTHVTLPAQGTGDSLIEVAVDLISSENHQLIKQEWGAAGTATQVAATSAAALPTQDIGTGTNTSGQVTVTNSSTTIVSSRAGRRAVLLVNNQTVAVYIDPSGGTATTSLFRLDPGAGITLETTTGVTGITSAAYTASGDAKVHYIELYT